MYEFPSMPVNRITFVPDAVSNEAMESLLSKPRSCEGIASRAASVTLEKVAGSRNGDSTLNSGVARTAPLVLKSWSGSEARLLSKPAATKAAWGELLEMITSVNSPGPELVNTVMPSSKASQVEAVARFGEVRLCEAFVLKKVFNRLTRCQSFVGVVKRASGTGQPG